MAGWFTYLKRGNGLGKKSLLWHPGHISDQTVGGRGGTGVRGNFDK